MQTNNDEKQNVSHTGGATGGTITLTLGGQTTAGIAFNATAAAVQAALELLSTIGVGNVLCTGGPLPGIVTCEFRGTLKNTDVAAMTASAAGLTGGAGNAVVLATLTPGNAVLTERTFWATGAFTSKEGFPGQRPDAGATLVDADGV